ncbi:MULTISPECIES: fumarylacetoacetate hydrolase family protein [unclassified Mesorhizobium]|uniref:fumarylacetoacetate hydrolase family protein n=1 Tax=unclassified Mesorhizobium TaxID=325217 RepID=UPI000FD6EE0B|nr:MULTISPECIES: fumarylacetoacetate hydrolase family protein [unclassified Mesorhizobium]RWE22634.1 MAG: FAA hydrolase family protein [Mesorhizobium sp.]TGQ19125.1 FAA hydrolase family protein [Mesorhizobium sp. M00.F.Ca.ET.217.01.1.1]TGV90014.1 FAA hydrolase family protein [Mesorhizobium sp. M00.F.Ca.ET.158.01.1.1]
MKLLRFGQPGSERPGLLDKSGAIRDLSSVIPDIRGSTLSRTGLDRLRSVAPSSLPRVDDDVRLGPPVADTRHFIAVGLNYIDHAIETGTPIPDQPVIFSKAPSCIVGPNDDILMPRDSRMLDWEVEVAVVIGERAFELAEEHALSVVAGYLVCHDVSEREFQIHRGGQWIKGKSSPSFGPLGPWLVTPDEVPDPQNLNLWLTVNGFSRQSGSTAKMIFSFRHLISYISRFMALEPGDIITTGTPHGVGLGMKPPVFLKSGDVVELGADGLGRQRQSVVVR